MPQLTVADAVGWVATAIFLSSYRCRDPRSLRRTQALAACLWVGYGVLLQAWPVIVANLLVAGMAAYSSRKRAAEPGSQPVRLSTEPDRFGTSSLYS